MKTLRLLVTVPVLAAFSGVALGQGHDRHSSGWSGPNAGASGGWHVVGYRGWYGPNVGIYFGAPVWWGPYPYPYYAHAPYYPYPVYVNPRPTVYVQKPPVIAAPTPWPPVARTEPSFKRYTLSAKKLFAFDNAEFKAPQPKLDEIAVALMRNRQIRITITGYTDRLGSDAYNLELSQRRADAVRTYLVGKGVAAGRLIAIGKGKANPVIRCEETSRARLIACLEPNRRVEIEPFTIEHPIG